MFIIKTLYKKHGNLGLMRVREEAENSFEARSKKNERRIE